MLTIYRNRFFVFVFLIRVLESFISFFFVIEKDLGSASKKMILKRLKFTDPV